MQSVSRVKVWLKEEEYDSPTVKAIVWFTRPPYDFVSRNAKFCFTSGCDDQWCVDFEHCDGTRYYVLTLHQLVNGQRHEEVRELDKPLHIRCYMVHVEKDKEFILPQKTTVTKTDEIIWSLGQRREEIYSTLPWMYYRKEVKIVIELLSKPLTKKIKLEIDEEKPATSRLAEAGENSIARETSLGVDTNDYSILLKETFVPDLILQCEDFSQLAHRCILGARSQHFRKMFRNDLLESNTGFLEIPRMDTRVFLKFIKYMYSGKLELSEDTTADLYEAACDQAVPNLRKKCADWIVDNIKQETCLKYLKLIHLRNDNTTKAELIKYIIINPEIFKTQEWLEFSRETPMLGLDVYEAFMNKHLM